MLKKLTTVVLLAALPVIAGVTSFLITKGEPANGVETQSTCMPSPCRSMPVLPSTTVSATPVASTVVSAPKTTKKSTTTTSQVPPKPTPEQEANIPGPGIDTEEEYEFCRATKQQLGNCRLPESEGMGEDGDDYDLPSESAR